MSDNICQRFCKTIQNRGPELAALQPRNNYWQKISWKQYGEDVRRTCLVLRDLGVIKGVRVSIFAPTRYEWAVLDMAILSLGAITVPIFQNISEQDLLYQINHSESQVLICNDSASAQRLLDIKNKFSFVTSIISIDPVEDIQDELFKGSWQQLTSRVKLEELSPEEFKRISSRIHLKDLATLIYTSGTTGVPKGVLLAHEQIMSEVTEVFPLLGVTAKDRTFTFLPFAHILGRIELWGQALIGYTIGYSSSMETIQRELKEVQPTLLVGVPKIYEKIYAGILEKSEQSLSKKLAFHWALSKGRKVLEAKIRKKPLSLPEVLQFAMAKKTVFKRVQDRLGGRLRFAVSGGAPLSREIAEFFGSLGITILEGYGLTETTAAVCVNTHFNYQFGTVGKPIGDVEIREAEDGEVLLRSKKVMRGYYLDEESSHEAFTEDGFFKTGDMGHLNEQGFLVLTDRKKDLIKTSSGKYIAPQKLETLFKKHTIIEQVHLHGDRRKYMVALITLNSDVVRKYVPETMSSQELLSEGSRHPEVQKEVRRAVSWVNEELASHEHIKFFKILPVSFTVESGELTPSLKIKRKFCDTKYKKSIEELYA